MYLEHFGMREPPFGLTPNTRFLVNLPPHHEALNGILVALRSGEGFVKVTGEVGTGKTLLCRSLLKDLGERFVTAYLPDPSLSPVGLRKALAEELGISLPRRVDSHGLLRLIRDALVEIHRSDRRALLLVDEAQALSRESLEAIRLLTNLETESAKLLQVVLFGQPELDARLAQPSLRQLAQRITFSYQLAPMDRAGLAGYVAHRLAASGYSGELLFSSHALRVLHAASRGVPRLVNILCHKALMAAWAGGEPRVRRRHARRAIVDTQRAWTRVRLRRRTTGRATRMAASPSRRPLLPGTASRGT